MENARIFLHVSHQDQLVDGVLMQARGYDVRTVRDAHQVLREQDFAMNARNLRWAMSHVMMMCHFHVLHHEIEANDAVRVVNHVRALGGHVVHQDDLAFTSALMTREMLDAYDLAGDDLTPTGRVRGAVLNALRELGGRTLNYLSHLQRRADAVLGTSLKNPMVREQQKAAYTEPDELSTTG